ADEHLPSRLELVEEERPRGSGLDREGSHPAELDRILVVVDAAERRGRDTVDPELQGAGAGPGAGRALPVELDEVGPVADRQEARVGPAAVVPAHARLDGVG